MSQCLQAVYMTGLIWGVSVFVMDKMNTARSIKCSCFCIVFIFQINTIIFFIFLSIIYGD